MVRQRHFFLKSSFCLTHYQCNTIIYVYTSQLHPNGAKRYHLECKTDLSVKKTLNDWCLFTHLEQEKSIQYSLEEEFLVEHGIFRELLSSRNIHCLKKQQL